MLEAEVKFEIDEALAGVLQKRLAAAKAAQASPIHQRDIYFSHPSRDFSKTDEALRLRLDERGLFVTYKGRKLDPPRKTREEIEFGLTTECDTAVLMLERLGFSQVARVEKMRTEFTLEGPPRTLVCIDRIDELGIFCEVELSTESVQEGRDGLNCFLKRLDLQDLTPIPESYLELLLRRGA